MMAEVAFQKEHQTREKRAGCSTNVSRAGTPEEQAREDSDSMNEGTKKDKSYNKMVTTPRESFKQKTFHSNR